jgi:hypothetical protein
MALSTKFWTNGKLLKDIGPICPHHTVRVCFAPPMIVRETGKEEQAQIIAFIQKKLAEWV